MAPLAGVGDTPWANTAEQLARLTFEYGNRFYNYKGLRAFKDKWNPEWHSAYLAYPPQASLSRIQLGIIALVAGGYRRILAGRGRGRDTKATGPAAASTAAGPESNGLVFPRRDHNLAGHLA